MNPYHNDDAHMIAYVNYMNDLVQRDRFVKAVQSPKYAYARNRYGAVWVYHYDPKSPTGVLSQGGHHDIAFADATIRELRDNSPLSPTEGLRGSGAVLY